MTSDLISLSDLIPTVIKTIKIYLYYSMKTKYAVIVSSSQYHDKSNELIAFGLKCLTFDAFTFR